jgi:hypothetical protein
MGVYRPSPVSVVVDVVMVTVVVVGSVDETSPDWLCRLNANSGSVLTVGL